LGGWKVKEGGGEDEEEKGKELWIYIGEMREH
jgi:hypothetical protein